MLGRIWRAYSAQLQKRPLLVNMATASVLAGTGDMLAQKVEKYAGIQSHGKTRYNYTRTGRMMIWGLMSGGMCGVWYPWLGSTAHGMKLSVNRELIFKLGFDQIMFQPVCLNCFFAVTSILEGKTIEETKIRLQNKVFTSWMMAVPFWSSIQAINFKMVPVQYQSLVVYGGSLLFNSAMSVIAHAQEYGTPTERMLESKVHVRDKELIELRELLTATQHKLALAQQQITTLVDILPEERRAEAREALLSTMVKSTENDEEANGDIEIEMASGVMGWGDTKMIRDPEKKGPKRVYFYYS